jgi:hypothetical protein
LLNFSMMADVKRFLISSGWFILAVAELVAGPGAREHFDLDTAQAAAANGDRDAAYFLGRSFAKGIGVTQDHVRAAEYLSQAAKKGHAYAQNDLAVLYARGLGVEQNYALAAEWYLKAAEQGDAFAQYSLGSAYSSGRGT